MDNINGQQQNDQPWQLAKPQHEWQQILLEQRQRFHANPNDLDAKEAMEDATEALGVYDQAEAESKGKDRDRSIVNSFAARSRTIHRCFSFCPTLTIHSGFLTGAE